MNGEDSQIYDYGEPNDLSRRDSKRRRLLSDRLADDACVAELAWSSTAQHNAPNFFFDPASDPPSRMNENHNLPRSIQPVWDPQGAFQSQTTDLPAFNNTSTYDSRPYFYDQGAPESYVSIPPSSSWPPEFVEAQDGVYDVNAAYAGSLPVLQRAPQQQQRSAAFEEGIPYIDPNNGTKTLYEPSMVHGYTTGLALENDSTLSGLSLNPQAPGSVHFAGISHDQANTRNLPVLDYLATQIIQTVARLNHIDFQDLLHGTSEAGRQWLNTITLFEQARRTIAPIGIGFIDASATQTYSPAQQDIVRKANTAILIMSVLGASNVQFFHLDKVFLGIFVPLGHRLLKWQGAIYLELKTQTYILALTNSSELPETLLDELFPPDLESQVLQRHPDIPNLSPSEQDFIDRCKARRQYLLAESYSLDTRSELPIKYPWSDFIRDFSSGVSKNIDHILTSHRQPAMHGVMSRRRAGSGPVGYDRGSADSHHDVRRSISSGGHVHRVEKKATANGQTIRQAWVKAEEEALIAGLERVGGPHWSQILALYGRGGSISEVLKDRNQVQLKDKARNLKLWYLKMGQEVPISLRGVTGELRKRGGARARAALEAEEQGAAKERRSSDDTEQQENEPMLGFRHDTVDPSAYDGTQKR